MENLGGAGICCVRICTFSQVAHASVFTRFSLFSLFERTQDMASSDKDSSLICSLVLEKKCCKLQHIALHRNVFMLCFRCFYTRFAGFSVLSMCEKIQDMQGQLFDL